MRRQIFKLQTSVVGFLLSISFLGAAIFAQPQQPPIRSQEVSEVDGQPVLIKHLPDYEQVRSGAFFTNDKAALQNAVENAPVLEVVEFPVGTEAVTAMYPQGRLVIIEFTNPQLSVEADGRIQQHLASNPQSTTAYRRIGNYSAFVFGVSDPVAANELLDQVKYEKKVQWLGEDPYLMQKIERYLALTSRDIAFSTLKFIGVGLLTAILAGIATGLIFWRVREQRRAEQTAFSDAGGMIRLNLDGLAE